MRAIAQPQRVIPWLSLLLLSGPVLAGPVLHERFSPNPAEDLRYGATTSSGKMPAALETRSGLVSAPEEAAGSGDRESAYGGVHTPTSADASYHIDRLTTRPESVKYDEPFRPSILPFKRLYAFDFLKEDLSFGVRYQELLRVGIGGSVEQNEDAFFADFEVDLVANVPVRIPSVGPGVRIRALHIDPPQVIEILKDGADNLFVRGARSLRARMVMQLSLDRRVFGSPFPSVSWEDLSSRVSPVPSSIRDRAREVAEHIGVQPSDPPARALLTLVDYFRRFEASNDLPTSTRAADLYRELSFEQKGVCRHRAYAFAITALALGFPTRIVHNEAHAWVEVFDMWLWHRIDLGGAATDIQQSRLDPLAPQHRPPSDPYSWPVGSNSGASLARESRPQERASGSPDGGTSSSSEEQSADVDKDRSSASQGTASLDDLFDSGPYREPEVTFSIREKQLLRGHPLSISGSATRDGVPCRLSRIDVFMAASEGATAIGSVATDREGKFQGHVTLPPDLPVGYLELFTQIGGGCD